MLLPLIPYASFNDRYKDLTVEVAQTRDNGRTLDDAW